MPSGAGGTAGTVRRKQGHSYGPLHTFCPGPATTPRKPRFAKAQKSFQHSLLRATGAPVRACNACRALPRHGVCFQALELTGQGATEEPLGVAGWRVGDWPDRQHACTSGGGPSAFRVWHIEAGDDCHSFRALRRTGPTRTPSGARLGCRV